MIVRELVTKLGFEVDYENLAKFERSIDKFKRKVNGLSGALSVAKKGMVALAASATGLSLLTINTAKAAKSTELLAEQLGITTNELQELELVAQNSVDDFNGLENSFMSFNSALNKSSSASNQASKEIQSLGISLTGLDGKLKQSKNLYFEVAHAVGKVGDANKQLHLSRKLFGQSNTELVKILSEGNEAYAKRREEVLKLSAVIDRKGLKSSRELTKSWRRFGIIIDNVKKELSIKFIPVFNKVLKQFEKWFVENKEIISQNITGFINVLSSAFSILGKIIDIVLTPIKALIELFGGLENTVRVLGVALTVVFTPSILSAARALGVLAVSLLTNPITAWISLITAAGVAIGLLIDDLYHFANGAKSVTALVLKYFFDFEGKFEDIINNITDFFFDKFTAIKNFFESVIDSFSFGLKKTVKETNKAKEDISFIDEKTGLNVTSINDPSRSKIRFVKKQPTSQNVSFVDKQTGLNVTNVKESKFFKNDPVILRPDLSSLGNNYTNNKSVTNRVTQNITENISISVPAGTNEQQASIITEQVSEAMQKQFDSNILRGKDSVLEG
jgi:hypothetical protein